MEPQRTVGPQVGGPSEAGGPQGQAAAFCKSTGGPLVGPRTSFASKKECLQWVQKNNSICQGALVPNLKSLTASQRDCILRMAAAVHRDKGPFDPIRGTRRLPQRAPQHRGPEDNVGAPRIASYRVRPDLSTPRQHYNPGYGRNIFGGFFTS